MGGRPALVVAHVNSARLSALRNAALVTEIVNALPPSTEVLLTLNDPGAFTVASNPWPDRIRFLTLSESRSYTIWPQDPFLVLEGDAGQELLLSAEFGRADDADFGVEIGRSLGWPVRRSALAFEGGNIVSDGRTVFIGANTVRANAVRLEVDDEEVARRFEDELGLPVLVVGPLPQPVGHVDMMLTPLGHDRLVLADPGSGARIAAEALAADSESVRAFERSCEELFFGDAGIEKLVDLDGKTIEAPSIVGKTGEAIRETETIEAALEGVAKALRDRGYAVERVPFLFVPPSAGEWKPGYPTLTYNNVLLERAGEERRVYLARYGLSALDEAAAANWRSFGFRVVQVPGLTVSAMYGGSLRCCVKVLRRE